MKTTQKSKFSKFLSKFKVDNNYNKQRTDEDDLIVISDVTSGREFYLAVIDNFVMSQNEYVVMHNYEPDDGNHAKPELVIMRTEYSEKTGQVFYSIKDSFELEAAFTAFIRRFYENEQKNRSRKNAFLYTHPEDMSYSSGPKMG